MRKKKKDLPAFTNIEIIDIAADGKSVARVENQVIFVKNAVPGDVVDVKVTNQRRRYMEGQVTAFQKYSEKRSEPFCVHFGVCGGCAWQNIDYQYQLEYKNKQVYDSLKRIGGVEPVEAFQVIPSEKITHYRNKLEFTFSNNRWLTPEEIENKGEIYDRNALGFHIPGLFDKIVDLKECHLQSSPSNEIRQAVKDYVQSKQITHFDIRNHAGFLRNLIVRTTSTGETMVILSLFHENEANRIGLLDHLFNLFPQITSLMYVINGKNNDTILDQDIVLYKGLDYITEELDGLKFRIGPKSFFQTNSAQALTLYRKTLEYAALSGNEIVYDLYTGTGTIANFVAGNAKKVIGIENVPEAIEDAKLNSKLNDIQNTFFFTGDIKDTLNEDFINDHGKPDVIILDPPRAGIHEKVIEAILAAQPKRIVYVSCNPATQARDIALLSSSYKLLKVQPVDMFPHTQHIENIALLERVGE